jgi:hypothetical protein
MSLLVAYWRFRAEEVRTITDGMKDAKNKLLMVGVQRITNDLRSCLKTGL